MDKQSFARNCLATLLTLTVFGLALVFCVLVFLFPNFAVGRFLTPQGMLVILLFVIVVFASWFLIICTWKNPRSPPQ